MPLILNMAGQPYLEADAVRYLKRLRDGEFDAVAPSPKFSTTHGINPVQEKQKSIAEVLRQKQELATNIKKSYDEHTRPGGTQDALFELGRYVAYQIGAAFIAGPLKGWDGVIRKTLDFSEGGYKGDYGQMKDEVRITLVGDTAQVYQEVCDFMRVFCRLPNKMGLIKNKTRNPDLDPCGYSDTNIVVRLPNGQPGEVQVNNRAVLYGKMSKASFCRDLKVAPTEYAKLAHGYGLEGGLGHAFYEIYDRVSKGGDNGKTAAKLSKRYYNLLRAFPLNNVAERTTLTAEINTFKEVPVNKATFAH